MQRIERANDLAGVYFLNHARIEQRFYVAVHRLYIPPEATTGLAEGQAPAPVMARSRSHRLPESPLNKSVGVSTLILGVLALPDFHVCEKSLRDSDSVRTSMTMVLVRKNGPLVLARGGTLEFDRKNLTSECYPLAALIVSLEAPHDIGHHTPHEGAAHGSDQGGLRKRDYRRRHLGVARADADPGFFAGRTGG